MKFYNELRSICITDGFLSVSISPCHRLYLSDASNCTSCDPGMYCGSTGLVKPSGPCDAGFFCLTNGVTPTPPGKLIFKC